MFIAEIEKEWAEVRRKGRGKVEDWSWTVNFFDADGWIDRHYISNEADAKMIASLFEAGAFTRTEFGGVCFDTAFA
jgi:hypothetical protein